MLKSIIINKKKDELGIMNQGRNSYHDDCVDYDDYDDDILEEKYGRGGYEKINKVDTGEKSCSKKKVKHRQLVDVESF
jgi:hypothetical protein